MMSLSAIALGISLIAAAEQRAADSDKTTAAADIEAPGCLQMRGFPSFSRLNIPETDGRYNIDHSKRVNGAPTYWKERAFLYNCPVCGDCWVWAVDGANQTAWEEVGKERCSGIVVRSDNSSRDPSALLGPAAFFAEGGESPVQSVIELCPEPKCLSVSVDGVGAAQTVVGPETRTPWLAAPVDAELVWPEYRSGQAGPMAGMTMYTLGRVLPAGTVVSFACPTPPCELNVYLYHNPPFSGATNGGLPRALPENGWATGSCAPKFSFGLAPTCLHRMTAFRKLMQQETDSFTVGGNGAAYVVVVGGCGMSCEDNSIVDQTHCEMSKPGLANWCGWSGDSCGDTWCQKRPGTGGPSATGWARAAKSLSASGLRDAGAGGNGCSLPDVSTAAQPAAPGQ
eukprot:TRINITY_DN2679_c2_g1_i1.p1 TRINITY_DN2679_c2_g1~~TRINITY_DN2679_c2_g1_i1.p1  ORF type:complete len:397 (+),score=49.80 TRINITY_DN2679_c2_g1_i1:181-1371(+)